MNSFRSGLDFHIFYGTRNAFICEKIVAQGDKDGINFPLLLPASVLHFYLKMVIHDHNDDINSSACYISKFVPEYLKHIGEHYRTRDSLILAFTVFMMSVKI